MGCQRIPSKPWARPLPDLNPATKCGTQGISLVRAGNTTHQLIDARIVGHKPASLGWAAAAALPLTALTAWEGLFERLNIQDADADKTLLIIGGAGGVGSLAIPFAKHNSKVNIIATASREDSARWCRERGADPVVNYRDLKGELAKQGITYVDYIFILNDTDGHWDAVSELIAPQGHICSIVENAHPLNQDKLKSKSAALHWEFMYTRSMYQTADMARQGEILNEVAAGGQRRGGKLAQRNASRTERGALPPHCKVLEEGTYARESGGSVLRGNRSLSPLGRGLG